MRLSEIYIREVVLKEFWKDIDAESQLSEGSDAVLSSLLDKARVIIFDKFKIDPSMKEYFIAGSARLYLHKRLRDAFGLTGNIGDLDIVIPNKEIWYNAGLEKEWNAGGIYRPTTDGSIEAFNVWDPRKAGGEYADFTVRPTSEILADSTYIDGFYFMSIQDIVDYKTNLGRDKEQDVLTLITRYQQGNVSDRADLLKRVVNLIGIDKTKEFLNVIKNRKT